MAARPSRLIRNRHGTYTLRWIVPVRCRDAAGGPREVRFSLRTRDPVRARILALEFNLALERAALMSPPFDRGSLRTWTLTAPGVEVKVEGAEDREQFTQFLREHPDFRKALIEALRSGADRKQTVEAAIESVKAAVAAVPRVPRPTALGAAVETFVATRVTLSDNRRVTAGEKKRTLRLLLDHLAGKGVDVDRLQVHDLARPDIVDFVNAYASREGKADAAAGLSSRTVLKAVGHIADFFDHAVAQQWAAATPVDDAFHKAIAGIRARAAKAKASQSYDPFDEHDLRLIFEPEHYLRRNNASDDFWAPLVGLYTGARLGEIVTLALDGVVRDPASGLWCLKIGTKNANSQRLVPVPAALVDLGFLEHVEHVRQLGATVLFPHREANATRIHDPSKHASRVFGQYLNDVGIRDPKKVFHSFRHLAITRMHVRKVPSRESELIVGHAAQDMLQRLGAAGSTSAGARHSTHLRTYVHAGEYEQDGVPLQVRLKAHLDTTLDYPLDLKRLRIAARIVREHVTVDRNGARPVYTSGWHTNKRAYAEERVRTLNDVSADSGCPSVAG